MDTIFQEIFTTLRDDVALRALVGTDGAARFHRSWPTQDIEVSAANPGYVIVALASDDGDDAGDGVAVDDMTFDVHMFARHRGFGQSRVIAIYNRVRALLNLKSFSTATWRVDNVHGAGSNLDLYDEETACNHGVAFYKTGKIIPVT